MSDGGEELRERRRRIRERVFRRSSPELFGVALVTVIFAYLLFSSAPLPWKSNVSQPAGTPEEKVKVSLSASAEEKPAAEPEKKMSSTLPLKPPVPEGFNRSRLVKVSIADDSQSAFWSNLEPTAVVLDDAAERKSGKDSLEVRFIGKRKPWVFAEHNYPELVDWGKPEFVSFWFRGNRTGITYDFYVYFNKKWNNYIVFRIRDIYDGWQHFVFSTEKNVIKSGEPDWSRVWKVRLVSNNKSYRGVVYFDDFALWVPEEYVKREEVKEERVYGMGDTITVNGLSVTLLRFWDRFDVVNYVGSKTYTETYVRVDVRVKNTGSREIKLAFTPYKPVLIDDRGETYDYYYVKVRTRLGNWVPQEDQLKLDVLYPGSSREGAIFFKPLPSLNVNRLMLVMYLNGRKYQYNFSRW